jgi:hypothetical protein
LLVHIFGPMSGHRFELGQIQSSFHWPTSRREPMPAQHVERDPLHVSDAVHGALEVVRMIFASRLADLLQRPR